nr:reverse transcriptase domain-containing protein [Tanacetum cinerariifolium]
MLKYAKFLKGLLSKEKDPGSFDIPYDTGDLHIDNTLADVGASISLMPNSMCEKLGFGKPKPTRMSLELTDRAFSNWELQKCVPLSLIKALGTSNLENNPFKNFTTTRASKQDAKPRLIRWVLLLQGSDIEIRDEKRAENLDADHLSRLENPNIGILTEIADKFPDEHLMVLKTTPDNDEPWYADYVNYIVVKYYFWDEPYAFRLCPHNIMRRCDTGNKISDILAHCHSGPTGGHHSDSITKRKVYESGFFWPNIFRDAKDYVEKCDACQKLKNISSQNEMPQNNIQVCDVFDGWGLDFMGTFLDSKGNKYILVAADYVSKWVEAQAMPTNDARVVVKFLKGLFSRFKVPKALISDRGTHFCNSQLEKALQKYGVTHKMSTAFHHQTNGQTEVTNRAIKRILECFMVNGHRIKKYYDGCINMEGSELVELNELTR